MVDAELLVADLVALHAQNLLTLVMGPPSRRADELDGARLSVVEDVDDILEGLVGCLGEHEEDVDEHSETENGEQHIGLPGDVVERGRHEES